MSDQEIRDEVKRTLALLVARAPGRGIEVRIPPFAAIQCGDGPRHSRGTPPNVIEMSADTWLSLASGAQTWEQALAGGSLFASGTRADLSAYLPLTVPLTGATHVDDQKIG
ncbi:MAG: hypothetical protein H7227_04685 [Actinobacteria bacterium]|nr:hypothetical protein [Actinomycetota bacterium]